MRGFSPELSELTEVMVSSVLFVKPLRVERSYSLSSSFAGDDDRLRSAESLEKMSSVVGANKPFNLKPSPPNGGRSVRRGEPRMLRELDRMPICGEY